MITTVHIIILVVFVLLVLTLHIYGVYVANKIQRNKKAAQVQTEKEQRLADIKAENDELRRKDLEWEKEMNRLRDIAEKRRKRKVKILLKSRMKPTPPDKTFTIYNSRYTK